MRPFDDDFDDFDEYEEFEEIDELGYGGVQAIRRMIQDRKRNEYQFEEDRRGRQKGKHRRKHDDWSKYDDFDSSDYFEYNADEFDRYSGLDVGHY